MRRYSMRRSMRWNSSSEKQQQPLVRQNSTPNSSAVRATKSQEAHHSDQQQQQQQQIVATLITAEEEREKRDRILCEALFRMEFVKAEALIEEKRGLKYVDPYGRTVLHVAILSKAPVKIIRALVERGLDPVVHDQTFRRTPLHLAVITRSRPEVFEALLRPGVNPNPVDKFHETPLGYSVKKGLELDSLERLIQLGANVAKHPLMGGAVRKDIHLVALLLRYGYVADHFHMELARMFRTKQGDEIYFLIAKARTMIPLCRLTLSRFITNERPRLSSDILRLVMLMTFGTQAPRLRPISEI